MVKALVVRMQVRGFNYYREDSLAAETNASLKSINFRHLSVDGPLANRNHFGTAVSQSGGWMNSAGNLWRFDGILS